MQPSFKISYLNEWNKKEYELLLRLQFLAAIFTLVYIIILNLKFYFYHKNFFLTFLRLIFHKKLSLIKSYLRNIKDLPDVFPKIHHQASTEHL